ncbi:MAG: hypothetical protein JNK05_22540 [Myxococcales bacterium]|nr:hypothetical protein [Myxococcales bacterium]
MRFALFLGLVLVSSPCFAQSTPPPPPASTEPRAGSWNDYRRAVALEFNVMWPIFPGGIYDLRVQIPVVRADRGHFRGELVLGVHTDFAWRSVRDPNAGRVAFLGGKVGWRQFFGYGIHLEVVLHAGWRHEEQNPWDGMPIHSFQGRLWSWLGYQHEFTTRFYANVRGGLGVHTFRTDRFADRERLIAGGGDINLGFRFQ